VTSVALDDLRHPPDDAVIATTMAPCRRPGPAQDRDHGVYLDRKDVVRAKTKTVKRRRRAVQTLLHDEQVHDRLGTAFANARVLYLRATRRSSAAEALLEDRKGRKALRRMLDALADALVSVRGAEERRRHRKARYVIPIVIAGGVGVVASSEGARERVLALAPGSHDGGDASSAYTTGSAAG
jgi:hypothetical protein